MSADTIRIESPDLCVTVSDAGAEMQQIEGPEGALLWHGDPAFWSGRAPLLFPIVGRAPGDIVAVDGHSAPMRQHGFARRATFQRIEATPARCCHLLTDSAETRALYPRPFRLEVTHAVEGPTLAVSVSVHNTGTAPMPFGLGFHPAFSWPLPGAEGLPHEVVLDNAAEPLLARLEDGFLTAHRLASPFTRGRLALDPSLFEADALIFPTGAGHGLRYGVTGGPGLRFAFSNLPNLGLWTKPGARFLCIEPWHGMAARAGAGPEIADRPESLVLAPGATADFAYTMTLD